MEKRTKINKKRPALANLKMYLLGLDGESEDSGSLRGRGRCSGMRPRALAVEVGRGLQKI